MPAELKRSFELYCEERGSNPSEMTRMLLVKLLEGSVDITPEQMAARNAYARAYSDIIGAIDQALGRFR